MINGDKSTVVAVVARSMETKANESAFSRKNAVGKQQTFIAFFSSMPASSLMLPVICAAEYPPAKTAAAHGAKEAVKRHF